jgi:hypothetical protein
MLSSSSLMSIHSIILHYRRYIIPPRSYMWYSISVCPRTRLVDEHVDVRRTSVRETANIVDFINSYLTVSQIPFRHCRSHAPTYILQMAPVGYSPHFGDITWLLLPLAMFPVIANAE